MNKSRVEAFTDAIVAIIMTIMALEINIPKGPDWGALFAERSYFLAFFVSFFLLATAWYNHHHLFENAKTISQRAFWVNIIWLFDVSFTPVATGWVSEQPNSQAAAYFYLIVYTLSALAFGLLAKSLASCNPQGRAKIIEATSPKRNLLQLCLILLAAIAILWCPLAGLLILGVDVFFWIFAAPRIK